MSTPETNSPKPLALIILDGWGISDADETINAIKAAKTPVWDELWAHFPHITLDASGSTVGLPKGQMGNSEVGHLHIGAGREVPQSLVRIDNAIADKHFFENPALCNAIDNAAKTGRNVHILGLFSPGGVHSHQDHIFAAANLSASKKIKNTYIHAFLDGRDTPPQSAQHTIEACKNACDSSIKIASLCGRYYAMDRDNRWDRTEKAYDMLTSGKTAFHFNTATEALNAAYERGETDEFVQPTLIHNDNDNPAIIKDGDVVVFMNFRADRARQLTRALTMPLFTAFDRKTHPNISAFVTLTEYAHDINTDVAFAPKTIKKSFGEIIAEHHMTQLRIAETEKYAHVTFFFNGGIENKFEGEERTLIPSPHVNTYDLKPEMSAKELTDILLAKIKDQTHDVIICNFANPDMVGHTGNFDATVKAVETIDACLGRIIQALNEVGGVAFITADHGNAEQMHNTNTKQAHTAHTTNPVPFVCTTKHITFNTTEGTLYDIAPTLLHILGLTPPKEMTGSVLVK